MEEQELKQYLIDNHDCVAYGILDENEDEVKAITIPKFIEIIKNLDPNFIVSNG